MKNILKISLFVSVLFFANNASAQQLEKTYNDWSIFTLQSKGEKMCYIASTPKKKSGNYKKRGEPYLIVTHRSKTVDEVSASSGYPYKKGSTVSLIFDKKDKYNLFTTLEVPDVAWARDSDEDAKIVANMKRGLELVISGKSRLKTSSKDTYSLRGFTLAYRHMKKACK
jgi:hypothetical protein